MPERRIEPPSDAPAFPEREHYGCVNCGSTNHTTGDKDWCPAERNEPPFDSSEPIAWSDQ